MELNYDDSLTPSFYSILYVVDVVFTYFLTEVNDTLSLG